MQHWRCWCPAPRRRSRTSLPQAVVQVKIASDGSLLIREDITFSFAGSFSGAYRDIPLRDGESIDLVAVERGGPPLPARRQHRARELIDRPDRYGVERTGNRVRVVWHYRRQRRHPNVHGLLPLSRASRRLRRRRRREPPGLGHEWPVALYDLRAQMELPRPIGLQGTRYRVWGAPAWVNGVVDRARTGDALYKP